MALTCLQIIQTVAKRVGLTAPTSAIGSTITDIIQLIALCEEEGQEQARYPYQVLQQEATFTTAATQIQSTLAACTTGFGYIVNDTIWNRTLRRPVYGPSTQQSWQQQKAMQINGPFNTFRIQNGNINFYPTPVAGQSCYFEYISKNWITLNGGGTSSTFANDADVPMLDDQLVTLGTIWRYKAAKGLSYSEDFAKYERQRMDIEARDASKPILSMGGAMYDVQPVILVPRGNW